MTFREENTLLVNAVLGVPSGFEYSQPKSRKTPKNTAFQYRLANSGNFRQIPANSGNFRQIWKNSGRKKLQCSLKVNASYQYPFIT